MKKNRMRQSIYARIFVAFIIIYLLMMISFTMFLVSQEKLTVESELKSYSSFLGSSVAEILNKHVDDNNQITDITEMKKEFLSPSMPMFDTAEAAIFTGDYELVYNTTDFWKCSYSENVDGNTNQVYGLLNPETWFSEEDIKELEYYLYAKPKAEKPGDLYEYSLNIGGIGVDNEMIIPDKIYVTPMYASSFDEYGNVNSGSGEHREDLSYSSGYLDTKGLPYFEHGSIVPRYNNINNQAQDALRLKILDQSNLKKSISQISESIISTERVNVFVHRYFMIIPYETGITFMDDNSLYSDFWTMVGIGINIWDRISTTLIFVWISCLIIFIITAYILSRQTYRTYLKQVEMEEQRKEMTDALAHDLKTPLSIISGYAQNLQENIHTEKREHYSISINENVKRMDRIIHKMLEMTRLESDCFSVNLQEVSLNKLCSEVINHYKQLCEEKGIAISLEGDAVIKADKSLIERVIDNFVINSIDNTPEYGKIIIKILDDILEVYNSGSHISEDRIEEVWLPYKKGNTERSNTKGTGLGLSISRRILDLHEFSYGVKNSKDGVVFWFSWSSLTYPITGNKF
jgi:signal transduction histidine kinase